MAPPPIRPMRPGEAGALLAIWERAVRATHAFLGEADIAALLPVVRDRALPALEVWVLEQGGAARGFMGLHGASLEALFLDPGHFGRGGGRLLVEHARRLKGPLRVDVNEDNPGALAFYRRMGFAVTGRSALDQDGRPFPLLHMAQEGAAPAAQG